MIDYAKCPLKERTRLIDDFIKSIDNWAICDTFCCNSVWAKREDKEQLWRYITELLHGRDEWSIRVGTVLAMCHYLDDQHIDRTLNEINSIDLHENEPYYVRMGIAWLLATALAKNEAKTKLFVRTSSLPSDIIKLYVRKARESFRTRNIEATYSKLIT